MLIAIVLTVWLGGLALGMLALHFAGKWNARRERQRIDRTYRRALDDEWR